MQSASLGMPRAAARGEMPAQFFPQLQARAAQRHDHGWPWRATLSLVLVLAAAARESSSAATSGVFDGVFVSGNASSAAGLDALSLIDAARRSLGEGAAPELLFQTMPMLYSGGEDVNPPPPCPLWSSRPSLLCSAHASPNRALCPHSRSTPSFGHFVFPTACALVGVQAR